MKNLIKSEITLRHLLIPMGFMALTLLMLFAFQMTQVMGDRDALHARLASQENEVQAARKINNQFAGLVMGTRKLANAGNKGAQKLVGDLQRLGVIPNIPQKPAVQPPVPVPQGAPGAPAQKP